MSKQFLCVGAVIAFMLVMAIVSTADVPQLISFQGKLYDSEENPLTGQYEITFRIYDVEEEGTVLWTETVNVNCENGFYNVILGQITPLDLDFAGQYWLGVQVTGDDELLPRYRLVSVPTAFRAQVANQVSWTNLTDVPAGFADGTDDVGEAGGVSQIDAGTCIEVANPTGPTATVAHAANATALPDAHHTKTTDASELTSGLLDNAHLNMGHGNGIDADMVDGQHASNFLSTTDDWGRSGVATDLYEGTTALSVKYLGISAKAADADKLDNHDFSYFATATHNHDAAYVNEGQANSVTSGMIVDGTIQEADLGFTPGGDGHSLDASDGTPADAVYVDNVGNVGIGTTTPGHELDVSGTVSGTNNSSDGMGVYGLASNNGDVTNYGGYFQSDGLKGVGVYGRATTRSGNNRNYGGYFQSDGAYGIGVYAEATVSDGIGVKGVAMTAGDCGGYFVAGGSLSSMGVYGRGSDGGQFTATGNHGVGVSADGGNEGWGVYAYSASGKGVYGVSPNGIAGHFSSSTGYGLIVDSGNVGIGTESPEAKLDVRTPSGSSTIVKLYSGSVGTHVFYTSTGNHARMVMLDGSGNSDIAFRTDGDCYFNTSGNFGIGTTSPGYKLDVAGSAHASSFPTSSDARLKTNVTQLTDVLEKLEKIRGVSFEWNQLYESLGRSTGLREIGVIAQEVEAVFPELVTTWGEENYRAVDYGRLAGVLIEAIKEQQSEIEVLKQKIVALEAERSD